jgi:GNAT superfamily N-acetyltransferase
LFSIRRNEPEDYTAISSIVEKTWHTTSIITRGKLYHISSLEGFLAEDASGIIGVLLYRIADSECEIILLQSLKENLGVGTGLLKEVITHAKKEGCKRIWLITTNDNTSAMHFYQRRGFIFAAIHINAMQISRQMKPQIPLTGIDGIPLRDEIEMEYPFIIEMNKEVL